MFLSLLGKRFLNAATAHGLMNLTGTEALVGKNPSKMEQSFSTNSSSRFPRNRLP